MFTMFAAGFVLLALSLTKGASQSYLAKCCPPGQIFSGEWNMSEVNCVSVPNSKIEVEVFQWNTAGAFQGFPRCDEPEDIATTPIYDFDNVKNTFEVPACLEVLHEQTSNGNMVIVIHCRSYKDRRNKAIDVSSFAHVRKCCAPDATYDVRTKTCAPRTSESPSLGALLPNGSTTVDLTVITAGPPKCRGPIVDYTIDKDDVLLRNGNYSVMVPLKNNLVSEEFLASENSACLDVMPDSDRKLVARVCRDPSYCDENACIRKCCTEDQIYGKRCSDNITMPGEPKEFHEAFASALSQTNKSTFISTKDYGVLIGKPCTNGIYIVDPRKEEWWLSSQGHIFVKGPKNESNNLNEYCMDIFYDKTTSDYDFRLFMCFPDRQKIDLIRLLMKFVLPVVSCMFLLITLLVYACLPSLQNLHGKTLMCHMSSLLLAYTCLAVSYWIKDASITCKAIAYTMLFSFLSAFSWLNVMCFDIWWTFGVLRGSTITNGRGHTKRFLSYCLYAWGLSLLLSSLTIFANCTDVLPKNLRPNFGIGRCWFSRKSEPSYSELTFFIAPITIQLMSNVVFFILTLVRCNKVKMEIKKVSADAMTSKQFYSHKNRFMMNVKLFIVMGISWIFEVISYFINTYFQHVTWKDAVFNTSDVLNCLQGLLIFILFVLKLRVYKALRKRLGLETMGGPTPTCNATTTLQDLHKVQRSTSSSTLMTTCVISSAKSSN